MLFQVDALEREVLEVLSLVRSIKNSFAPINQIPPEVFSRILDYYDEHGKDSKDRYLIMLTHVCRSWRNTFISCPSLWTQLHFANVEQTRAYIQRSRSSPLEFNLGLFNVINAFPLAIPHIPRLKSLVFKGIDNPLNLLENFVCHMPLLEKLDITGALWEQTIDYALFNGDLSSLRELRLHRVVTNFPWKNMANLRIVDLEYDFHEFGTAQMLDFFESAPLLHTVLLQFPMPDSSDAPPERTVFLRHLKTFAINADPTHSVLLKHLQIPFGTHVISDFRLNKDSPFPDHLPVESLNFRNLSRITTMNLHLEEREKCVRLSGPSGSLLVQIFTFPLDIGPSVIDRRIFHSLVPSLSKIQNFVISEHDYRRLLQVGKCPIFQTLSSMNDLQMLTLINCDNRGFIRALDPKQHPSNLVLCPKMEKLVLFVDSPSQICVWRLVRMAKNRASRGAKLSLVKVVDLGDLKLGRKVSGLSKHVMGVKYRVGGMLPAWDAVPGEGE